jgi:hypothetical protein
MNKETEFLDDVKQALHGGSYTAPTSRGQADRITRSDPYTHKPDIIVECGNPVNFADIQKSALIAIEKVRHNRSGDLVRVSDDAPYLLEAIPQATECTANGSTSTEPLSISQIQESQSEEKNEYMAEIGNRLEAGDFRRVGGTMDNIPPQKPLISHFTGALDWLEVSAYVEFNPSKYAEMMKKFEEAQSWARIDVKDLPDDEKHLADFIAQSQYVMIGGQRVKVLPQGVRKGMWCPIVLEMENGYKIIFNGRSGAHKTMPNVYVEITGKICLFHGAYEMLHESRKFIYSIGGEVVREKLSRVDEALDLPGISMSEFEEDFKKGSYITLGKKTSIIKSTGLTLGVGSVPLQIRIYDKLAKVKSSGEPIEELFLIHRRWQGSEPKSASRVEFQMNREYLKSVGVDTVNDYFRLRPDIVKYLVTDWFRFVIPDSFKSHHYEDALTSPLWSKIQKGFIDSVGVPRDLPLLPVPKADVDIKQIVAQINGLIEKCLVIHELTGLHPIVRGYYVEVALQKYRCLGSVVFSESAIQSLREMSENSQRMFKECSQKIQDNFSSFF